MTTWQSGLQFDATGNLLVSLGGSATFLVANFGAKGDNITDDTAAIQAAVTAANAHGGGVVLLDALTYYAPGGIQKLPGVFVVGQGANTSLDGAYSRTTGTWLRGNGTNPGFFWNNTPNMLQSDGTVSLLTTAQIEAAGLRNSGIANIGFDGYTRSIYVGELGNPGCFEGCTYQNLISINATQWGFYFENCVLTKYIDIRVYKMASTGIGTIFHGVSTFQNVLVGYNFGNCTHIQELAGTSFGGSNLPNCRGMVFNARAGGVHNQIVASFLQSSNGGALVSSSATTNGTTAISLTRGNGVNFPPDRQLIFSTSSSAPTQATGWGGFANGGLGTSTTNGLASFFAVPFMLTANLASRATAFSLANTWPGATGSYSIQFTFADGTTGTQTVTLTNGSAGPYTITALAQAAWKAVQVFGTVAGSTADYIQVAARQRGTPLAAGVSATNFVIHFGFPLLEVSAYMNQTDPYNTGGSPGNVQGSKFDGLDLEGTGTSMALFQNAHVTWQSSFTGASGNQGAGYAARYCFRGAIGAFTTNQSCSVDADGALMASYGTVLSSNATDPTRIVQMAPIGFYADASGSAHFNLGTSFYLPGNTFDTATFQRGTPYTFGNYVFASANVGNLDATYTYCPLGMRSIYYTFSDNGFSFGPENFGNTTYTVAQGAGLTDTIGLPTLPTAEGGQTWTALGGSSVTSMTGFPVEMLNVSNGHVLHNAPSGQNFQNTTGWTAIKTPLGCSLSLRTSYNGTNAYYGVLGGGYIPYYTTANPLIVVGGEQRWVHIGAVTPATFSTAALTNNVSLFQLPAGAVIHGVRIKHSTAFSGTGVTSYTISVGISGTVLKYANAFNVFQATSNTAYQDSVPQSGLNCAAAVTGSENFGASAQITANATCNVNLNFASPAGSADIWALVSVAI